MSDSKPLAVILKESGPVKTKAALVKLITDLAKFFNVGKQMSVQQVGDTADLILIDFKHLRIDDFKLCFHRIKAGVYGQSYDRMDGNVILVSLRAYDEERQAEYMRAQNEKRLAEEEAIGKYYVEAVGMYLVSLGDDYDWTHDLGLATLYSERDAIGLCSAIRKQRIAHKVTYRHINAPTKEFIKKVKEEHPQLAVVPKDKGLERRKSFEYDARRLAIESDESLSPFERENKLRGIAGLPALTESQYQLTQKVFEMNSKKGKKK